MLGEVEGVLIVVEVPDLEIPIDGVKHLRTEGDVLHLRAPHPLQAHWPLAGAESLADHGEHRSTLEQGRPLDPEDDGQDILAVEPVGPDFLEGELLGDDGLLRHRAVEEEWIGALSHEELKRFVFTADLLVHPKFEHLARWQGAAALLRWLRATEREVDHRLIGGDNERAPSGINRGRTHAEPIDDCVGEESGWTGVRKHVHDQDEMPRTLGTGEGVDVRDVGDRVGDGARAGDVVGHASVP